MHGYCGRNPWHTMCMDYFIRLRRHTFTLGPLLCCALALPHMTAGLGGQASVMHAQANVLKKEKKSMHIVWQGVYLQQPFIACVKLFKSTEMQGSANGGRHRTGTCFCSCLAKNCFCKAVQVLFKKPGNADDDKDSLQACRL
jgi:hypothetical protein